MKSLFTHHHYYIPHNKFILYFFSDTHAGVNSFDEDRFKRFVSNSQKNDLPVYYLGVGDYLDIASRSDNKRIKAGELHDGTVEWIDEKVHNDADYFIELCNPMKGRIIGLIGGNHAYSLNGSYTRYGGYNLKKQ